MNGVSKHYFDIGYMDTLSGSDSPLHRLDPRVKLVTTLVFIATVISFDRYAITALAPFFIYPIALIAIGGLPPLYLLKKILVVSPFAILVGIFNPLIETRIFYYIGSISISGGWVSFGSIIIKYFLTVSAALILIASTGFNAVCMALAELGVPRPFVTQLLFLYRYLFVLTEEAERMVRAIGLRTFDRKGIAAGTFVSLVGHLLLRALDRAERIYLAMCCRGFEGRVRIMRSMAIGFVDIRFLLGWTLLFITLRCYNLPMKIGSFITGLLR